MSCHGQDVRMHKSGTTDGAYQTGIPFRCVSSPLRQCISGLSAFFNVNRRDIHAEIGRLKHILSPNGWLELTTIIRHTRQTYERVYIILSQRPKHIHNYSAYRVIVNGFLIIIKLVASHSMGMHKINITPVHQMCGSSRTIMKPHSVERIRWHCGQTIGAHGVSLEEGRSIGDFRPHTEWWHHISFEECMQQNTNITPHAVNARNYKSYTLRVGLLNKNDTNLETRGRMSLNIKLHHCVKFRA